MEGNNRLSEENARALRDSLRLALHEASHSSALAAPSLEKSERFAVVPFRISPLRSGSYFIAADAIDRMARMMSKQGFSVVKLYPAVIVDLWVFQKESDVNISSQPPGRHKR